jgi:hypothetical protein
LGHERWDRKGQPSRSANAPAKRRKVAFEDCEGPERPSSSSPWTLGDQGPAAAIASSPGVGRSSTHDSLTGSSASISMTENTRSQPPNSDDQSLTIAHTASLQSPVYYHEQPVQNFNQSGLHGGEYESFNQLDGNEYLPFGPFDFSSFFLPPDTGPVENEWFSHDFYSAMRETGNEWGGLGDLLDPDFLSPGQDAFTPISGDDQRLDAPEITPDLQHSQDKASDESNEERPPHQGKISRISSPPNEASEEDKWPFQWNPNSRPILNANPISVPEDHPLFRAHNPRFDISETTFFKLRAFLKPPVGREFHQSQKGSFVLPSLTVLNVFIGLFFKHFSPQMPVLHHPTVNTNVDLPPPLLAAMVIIGAIYSHLKHTRRFSIVLLDIVRWNLQIALECNNNLMREPMIIYAEALLCHTGLWCGNKRAFELAEVVRGAVVTYIRRKQFQDRGTSSTQNSATQNLNWQWRKWIAEESQRRIYWVIFALDAQFPSLLNLPATIAIGEVSALGCPCDEEFWCASSARNWKNLLGPASVPPSRSFSAAVGPFVLAASLRLGLDGRKVQDQPNQLPVLNLNPWSAFLVLMAIQNQIFQFSQESLIARTFIDDEPCEGDGDDHGKRETGGGRTTGDINSGLRNLQAKRRDQLAGMLTPSARRYTILLHTHVCRCSIFLAKIIFDPKIAHRIASVITAFSRSLNGCLPSQHDLPRYRIIRCPKCHR